MTTPSSFYQHAQQGYSDGQGAAEPASLQETGHLWSAAASGGFKPRSVQNQLRPSSNGMSEQDYQRMLPTGQMLPTANAASDPTNQQNTNLRLIGSLPI